MATARGRRHLSGFGCSLGEVGAWHELASAWSAPEFSPPEIFPRWGQDQEVLEFRAADLPPFFSHTTRRVVCAEDEREEPRPEVSQHLQPTHQVCGEALSLGLTLRALLLQRAWRRRAAGSRLPRVFYVAWSRRDWFRRAAGGTAEAGFVCCSWVRARQEEEG